MARANLLRRSAAPKRSASDILEGVQQLTGVVSRELDASMTTQPPNAITPARNHCAPVG